LKKEVFVDLMGLVDGNLLDLTKNSCEKCNFRFLAGIERAALGFI
jgi:hypothetical protein